MKKLTTIIAAMAAVLLTGACNKAEVEHEGSAVTLDYTVSLAEAATKAAIGDGTTVNALTYAIYDGNMKVSGATVAKNDDNSFTFAPSFYYGKTYTVVMFAHYRVEVENTVKDAYTLDGYSIKKNKDFVGEAADVFTHKETVMIDHNGDLYINGSKSDDQASNHTVTLTRPVAQLVVATENFGDMTTAGASKIEVVLNAPASYNAMTGDSSTATAANYTSAVSNLGTIEVSDKSYCVVSLNYLFPTDTQDVTINVIKDNGDNTESVIRTITLTEVPLVANKKTQIYGNLVKGDIKFNVSINNGFITEVENKPVELK